MTQLDGVDLLLIDGNNLLHRLSGNANEGEQRLLLARLRGTLPTELRTILMLDGHAASGTGRRERLTAHLDVRHSGSVSADDALLELVRDQPLLTRAGTVVVTDDRALTERIRSAGGRTQRLQWLEALIGTRAAGGQSGIGAGRRRPGRSPARADNAAARDEERPAWTPGRGATRKRGNPRRQRHRRII